MPFTKEESARIWLSFASLSAAKAAAILDIYGSALGFSRAFGAPMRDILSPAAYERLENLHDRMALKRELDKLRHYDITVLTPDDERVPPSIKALSDPPIVLYLKGNPALLLSEKRLAIVGTRQPTAYGRMMAESIGAQLSKSDVTVVSGFARGIDTAAQGGAVKAGGGTIAVMGNGLDKVYPPENEALLRNMLDNGGLAVSEYPPGTPPQKYHFPQRNRLISALSQGILLIEGKFKGGGMITVNHAMEQGSDVFVLPGPTNCDMYEAPHALIRDGARLVTCAEDVLMDMGWEKKAPVQLKMDLTNEQALIIEVLDEKEMTADEIMEKTGMTVAKINSNLTMMELMGIIKQTAGRIFMKIKR